MIYSNNTDSLQLPVSYCVQTVFLVFGLPKQLSKLNNSTIHFLRAKCKDISLCDKGTNHGELSLYGAELWWEVRGPSPPEADEIS